MMRFLRLFAVIFWLVVPVVAVAGVERTPAEWVARLGADSLTEREEASAALLGLGSKARDAVRGALGSPDAEVQWRAKEIWKTLRWLVVPGADADVEALIGKSAHGKVEKGDWLVFVRKHGAESMRLVAKFREGKAPMPGYEEGLTTLLDAAKPEEVAQVIAQSGSLRPVLEKPLDDFTPEKAEINTAVNYMQIEMIFGNYRKAFDLGRATYFLQSDDSSVSDILPLCKDAAAKGKLFDYVDSMARDQIAAETDAGKKSAKLGFYVALYASFDRKDRIEALYDLGPGPDGPQPDVDIWRWFLESLLNAGLPARVVKLLPRPVKPREFYFRSCAEVQLHDTVAADADWQGALAALDAIKEKPKDEIFGLADLMREMNDKRAGTLFMKVLLTKPVDPDDDSNAWLRIGSIAEDAHRYGYAADCYEKGMELCPSALLTVSGSGVIQEGTGEETMRKVIEKLRAEAEAGAAGN
ncbi:MAG: hypothetical protein WCD79_09315 [Chthoniobacteraceae bacterium]